MYIWIGLSLCREDEDKIRGICRRINECYHVSEVAFILPQHISLKISFDVGDRREEVVEYLKTLFSGRSLMPLELTGITMVGDNLIWMDALKTPALRSLHNELNDGLMRKFGIGLNSFDGDDFHFHSTLFLADPSDSGVPQLKQELDKAFAEELGFPLRVTGDRVTVGAAEVCSAGMFTVCVEIPFAK